MLALTTAPTRTLSDQLPREQKSALYRHPHYESQLSKRGSFIGRYKGGISVKSKELFQKLLKSPQSPPRDTLFEDDLFEHTLDSIQSRNETRVIRDIAQLIVILGGQPDSRAGLTPSPFTDHAHNQTIALGLSERLSLRNNSKRLQSFIGNDLEDCSCFAATYDIYFPLLTSEVKCGASAHDVADRQNAHSQTVLLRGLFELFRLVGRHLSEHTYRDNIPRHLSRSTHLHYSLVPYSKRQRHTRDTAPASTYGSALSRSTHACQSYLIGHEVESEGMCG